eukprot:TRINITY_DN2404_c0_g1_i1.p1 TRINITY_DN2404_c0_g1~~TRINITY_DN2404_c0_g1_i1.p1  ORF type:complete len:481 (+),score=154.85 TRINITY_DN2404_c0_g1_i1:29-1444(+)
MPPKKTKTKKTKPSTEGINYEEIINNLNARITDLEKDLEQSEQFRNFYQLGRDKLQTFWDITRREVERLAAELRNKDRELEERDERHQTRIMLFKQHSHHLSYEHQNALALLKRQYEEDLRAQATNFRGREKELKVQKAELKAALREMQQNHDDTTRTLMQNLDQSITDLRLKFLDQIEEIQTKYEQRLSEQKEQLEDRFKNEFIELEDRKNAHIGLLMQQHEKSFLSIKSYYTDITRNNIDMIRKYKNKVNELKKHEAAHEKLIFELCQDNKRMKEPLDKARDELAQYKNQLTNYEKDKVSLKGTKQRLYATEKALKTLEWEYEVLEQKFNQLQNDRDTLYEKFEQLVVEAQQKSGLKNLILQKKVEALTDTLEKKEVQLSEVLQVSGIPQGSINRSQGSEEILEAKNQHISDLTIRLKELTKRHNEMIGVFCAKLEQYGISPDELGFEPARAEENVSMAPAGLVSKRRV